ncbi:MAG: CAP domain-containing protein [Actinomycetota bacterium]
MRFDRSRRTGWAGLAVLMLLAFLSTAFTFTHSRADAAERTSASTAPAQGTRAEMRGDFLDLTNEDRAEHDREALRLARVLSRYATHHSLAMADRGFLFHSSEGDLRAALEGTEWTVAGENVGVGDSLDDLQDAFMASAVHRHNILARTYDHAAVGVVIEDGRVWVTVVFYGD